MSKVKFKLNSKGVRELLRGESMKELVKSEATGICSRCGDGYEQDIFTGKNRCNAMVWAESAKAKRDNRKNNTILKAVKG